MAETTTLTLADFLLARIAEEEAAAWQDGGWQSLRWQAVPVAEDEVTGEGWDYWVEEAHSDHDPVALADDGQAQHIARWDPARVLAECEAKRRIVEWVTGAQSAAGDPPGFDPEDAQALTYALLMLALPYADHPDYDEGWRP